VSARQVPVDAKTGDWPRKVAGALNYLLTQRLDVVSVSAAYTVAANDDVIIGNATTAAFAITLSSAVLQKGRLIRFKKIDASANAVTITPAGAETIDGAATLALGAQWASAAIYSDGTNWLKA